MIRTNIIEYLKLFSGHILNVFLLYHLKSYSIISKFFQIFIHFYVKRLTMTATVMRRKMKNIKPNYYVIWQIPNCQHFLKNIRFPKYLMKNLNFLMLQVSPYYRHKIKLNHQKCIKIKKGALRLPLPLCFVKF